jgi:hypothetical protein
MLQNQRYSHDLEISVKKNGVCSDQKSKGRQKLDQIQGQSLRYRGISWNFYRWLSYLGIYVSILSSFYQPTDNVISSTWFLFHFPFLLLQKGISANSY